MKISININGPPYCSFKKNADMVGPGMRS